MWQTLDENEVLRRLKTSAKDGLNSDEVKIRKEKYGANKLEEKKKESIFLRFLRQFNDFMIIILIVASILSAVISHLQGENDYIDSFIIIVIVVLNAIMGIIQETKAERSIDDLKKLTPQMSKVIREGKIIEINAEDLVPGDLIILEMGKFVPADCRLIQTSNLKIEESSLTGEIEPVFKDEKAICKENAPLGEMCNMAFMSSIVVGGSAKAIVVETGMSTNVGKIAELMIQDEAPETPIQKKLNQVGKVLGVTCLIICLIIFVIGLAKKIDPIQMFMTSVGLAVAAIPEGLPAIVTIMLSIGVTKMAKKNSIIRKLPAVETLGCSNVICSDKTGTLTQNKMTVVDVKEDVPNMAIELATMCTNVDYKYENGKRQISGEPTEIAIVQYGISKGINKKDLYSKMERVSEIPFDSNRKMMSTIHKNGNGYRVISKGALDVLSKKCNRIYENGIIKKFDDIKKNKIQKQNIQMANKALRVIAVAYADVPYIPQKNMIDEIENNLIFVGLIGMMDPPKKGVKDAVEVCKKAGIKTVMITGDHLATASAIARELGILQKDDFSITGTELDNISQKQLEKDIKKYSVFARATPEHKVRIVKAWQKNGAVVAMTGDGVNDSPALKNADIGIAMGKNGTDVAKSSADMILTDDNFVTIVEAVKQGRNIYDNIRKAIHFLIATNIGEIVTIFMGLILGWSSPLLAIQLLWVNLVTDSFPAIALGLEKEEKDIMKREPVNSKKGIFSDGLWNKIITEGIMIGMLTLIAFSIGNSFYGLEVGRTMAFISIGLLELIHSFNIKSEESIFKSGLLENKFLIGSFVLGIFIQTIVVIVPIFTDVFKLVQLNSIQWIITIIISFLPVPIMELQKVVDKHRDDFKQLLDNDFRKNT